MTCTLWDLRRADDISAQQLFEVWHLSDPEDRNATGNGTGGATPAAQLWSAALAHADPDVGDAWDANDHIHGVDH